MLLGKDDEVEICLRYMGNMKESCERGEVVGEMDFYVDECKIGSFQLVTQEETCVNEFDEKREELMRLFLPLS